MKAKKYIKRVLLSLLLLVLAAGFTVGGRHVWKQYQEKKRLAQEPYFTEKKISYGAMAYMTGGFHCECSPGFPWDMKEEDWPDYSYYTLEATGDTEIAVTVLNYILFEDRGERYRKAAEQAKQYGFSNTLEQQASFDRKAAERAKQYGFSAENPITVDWVMEHPEEAVEIMHTSAYGGSDFEDKDYIYSMYKKITGKKVETEDESESDESESDVSSNQIQEEENWTDSDDYNSMLLVRAMAQNMATLMNSYLFEEPDESDRKAIELAEQYGFSAENPITADWVREHPEKMVEIMRLTPEGVDLLHRWNQLYIPTYEK